MSSTISHFAVWFFNLSSRWRLLRTSPQDSTWRYSQSTIIFSDQYTTYCRDLSLIHWPLWTFSAAILLEAARARERPSCNVNKQSGTTMRIGSGNDALPLVAYLLQFTDAMRTSWAGSGDLSCEPLYSNTQSLRRIHFDLDIAATSSLIARIKFVWIKFDLCATYNPCAHEDSEGKKKKKLPVIKRK